MSVETQMIFMAFHWLVARTSLISLDICTQSLSDQLKFISMSIRSIAFSVTAFIASSQFLASMTLNHLAFRSISSLFLIIM
jgi:hypothetical protein